MGATSNDKWKIAAMALAASTAALGAAHLFVRKRTGEAESGNRPIGQFITVDGVRLHYLDRGRGPAVVYLHGNGTSIQDFELSGVTALDGDHFRMIAFDRPGFGYSERPAGERWDAARQAQLIGKALVQLGVETPTVVAHSWGTLVALELASMMVPPLRSLVLISGYYFPSPRVDAALASAPVLPVLGPVLRNTALPLIGRLMWPAIRAKMFAPSRPTTSFLGFPVWMALRPTQLAAAGAESAMMMSAAESLSKRYSAIKVPAFIVCGEGDEVVDPDQSRRLHELLPSSELRAIPDAGHMVHHQIPGEILRIIRRAVEDGSLPMHARSPGSTTWPAASDMADQPRDGMTDAGTRH